MASLTSEFDSNTFVGEEMQHHLSFYFFSLTTDMNSLSQNTRVPAAHEGNTHDPGVGVHFFCFWLSANSPSSPVNGYTEGR